MQCPTCHQPILPEYYFCPNCGTTLHEPPLVTTPYAQLKLYAHSIVLPLLMFITISKWQGISYLRAKEAPVRNMGYVALILLVASTVAVAWYTWSAMQSLTQLMNDTLNTY